MKENWYWALENIQSKRFRQSIDYIQRWNQNRVTEYEESYGLETANGRLFGSISLSGSENLRSIRLRRRSCWRV